MLPKGQSITVICRFFDPEIKKTGAKAYRYTSCEERLAVAGLDSLFEERLAVAGLDSLFNDVLKKHQEPDRPTGAIFAKDEAIRCYLKGKRLSVHDVIYFGDSFRIGGSDFPVLNVDGITAI
ncbi:hypothetical protein C2W62_10500 [Candidatus Entotheonella serta]|nr:hypothetical protein C2W62_10500 [Candidatus Entotheonella serta]